MFHKILVPLDGSQEAERALDTALKLAQAAQGELLLLRSIKVVHMMMPAMATEYDWSWPEYSREQSRQEVRDYLEGVAERIEQMDIAVNTLAVEGDTASIIVDTAEMKDVDLIVMSAQGWSTARVRELGSITERVLHSASCPVLIIRAEPIDRMAIALDGSLLAERALTPGMALAEALQAQVMLLRVSEPETVAHGALLSARERQIVLQAREAAEAYLHDTAHHLDDNVQTFVVGGTAVVDSILDFARLHAIDLLVMSTHGRTGLRRWLYGSVTARVMRASHTSMLIIRPPDDELS